jgi:hypothetical protein
MDNDVVVTEMTFDLEIASQSRYCSARTMRPYSRINEEYPARIRAYR